MAVRGLNCGQIERPDLGLHRYYIGRCRLQSDYTDEQACRHSSANCNANRS